LVATAEVAETADVDETTRLTMVPWRGWASAVTRATDDADGRAGTTWRRAVTILDAAFDGTWRGRKKMTVNG
jgi:hypothetical protein